MILVLVTALMFIKPINYTPERFRLFSFHLTKTRFIKHKGKNQILTPHLSFNN